LQSIKVVIPAKRRSRAEPGPIDERGRVAVKSADPSDMRQGKDPAVLYDG
jgi:hypothetical protein